MTIVSGTLPTTTTSSVLAAPTTAFNVLRLKRELGGAGHVGMIGTGSRVRDTGILDNDGRGDVPGRVTSAASTDAGDRRRPTTCASGAFIQSYIQAGPPAARQPDGTRIGAGATAPGGWLRVAKEGGKHLLWSAEYTGAGRTLQYNDVGYMARQNLHLGKATLGWRGLEPGATPSRRRRRSRSRRAATCPASTSVALRARTAASGSATSLDPARGGLRARAFDDREVGDGTALERARLRRRAIRARQQSARAVLRDASRIRRSSSRTGLYATSAQGTLVVHRPRRWTSSSSRRSPGRRASLATRGSRSSRRATRTFGELTAKSASATLRASYAFTPRLRCRRTRRHFSPSATSTTCGRSAVLRWEALPSRCMMSDWRWLPPRCPRHQQRRSRRPTSRTPRSTSTSSSDGSTGSVRRSTSSTPTPRSEGARSRRWATSRTRPR